MSLAAEITLWLLYGAAWLVGLSLLLYAAFAAQLALGAMHRSRCRRGARRRCER